MTGTPYFRRHGNGDSDVVVCSRTRHTDGRRVAAVTGVELMFEGFELTTIDTGEARIRVRHGGSGPPLLMLHGNPQTHVMWHKIAPRLARDFTVVAADLRGYGESSKPPNTDDHALYSKRAMARDQVEVMRQL